MELLFPAIKFNKKYNITRLLFGSLYLFIALIFIYPLVEFFTNWINNNFIPVKNLKLFVINLSGDNNYFYYLLATLIFWFAWDFFQYWCHRLFHTKLFYRLFHQHHHNVELDVFATFRHNPLELMLNFLLIGIPTSIFFSVLFPSMDGKFHLYFITFILFLQHSNVKFGHPFSAIFITPQMHRIHHSENIEHWNHNFSQYFTFWDFIFGTLSIPNKNEYPKTAERINLKNIFRDFI